MQTVLPPVVSGALPVVGHTVEFLRDPVALIERGRREHGLLWSLRLGGKPAVVMLGPDNSRFFFSETDQRLSIQTAYPFFVRMFDPAFYFFAGPDEYLRQRSLVLPRFQGRQLATYVEAMAQQTRQLQDQLGDEGELDLVDTLGPLVMRIAAHAFLGPDLGGRLGMDFFELFRRFSGGMEPVLPLWLPLPRLLRARRARDELRSLVGQLIEQRRAQPLDPPDFLQSLAEARYADGSEVPDIVLINLVLMLVWAGHETTTGHISWAVIDLLQHPEELERVLQEQRAVLDAGGAVDLQVVNQLRHLDRALHETERLHPVAFMMARSAAEAFEHQGYRIPQGTMILVSPTVTHRLAEVYPDPDRYRPERFEDDPRGVHGLIGFGGGVHRCLGVHFAYLEMKVILTMLLADYSFELVDRDPRPVPGARTKWPQRPCRVRYRARRQATLRA
jgi:sterol 14alpha-demethylase